jgi:phosphopantothenoylcysteine decarboxylase/phosphopantothenate--cysteine ligase
LPEAAELAAIAESVLVGGVPPRDLVGRRVLVSAGGTREALDPVRFLGNRSSGKQGYALAAAARDRGARVTLVAANCALPDPAGVDVVAVTSAADLQREVEARFDAADVVVMAAAVADYRPVAPSEVKLKKTAGALPAIELAQNDDILAGLAHRRRERPATGGSATGGPAAGPILVGFAAETGDATGTALDHARVKFAAKGADVLVVNEVGENLAFESDDNAAVILARDGTETVVPHGTKRRLAEAVWDAVGVLHPGH